MNDIQIINILVCIKVIILGIVSLASIAYILPICFIRRFHTSLNLLSVNIGLTLFVCTTFWAIFLTMNGWYPQILWSPKSCLAILYLQTMVNNQVTYGLCAVSLNRLFAIVYRGKTFFHTKYSMIICLCVQWIVAAILPLPQFYSSLQSCLQSGLELSYQTYVLFATAIVPAVCLAVIYTIILLYAHRSSRRVNQMTNENMAKFIEGNQRNNRLLKHMVFMFVVFFIGWVPIYVIAVVYWNGTAISYVAFHAIQTLPAICVLINIVDLFWYNHDLRKYFQQKISYNITQHA